MTEVAAEGRLRDIPGIGEGISAAIMQILETGSFDAHAQLTERIPESLIELMVIPGVGAKTALRLHSELGVDSLAALEAALVSGRVRAAKGLGARAEAAMLAGIEAVQAFRTHAAWRRFAGRESVHCGVLGPATKRFDQPRWQCATVGGDSRRLGFCCRVDRFSASRAIVDSLAMVADVEWIDESSMRLSLASGQAAEIYLSHPDPGGLPCFARLGTQRILSALAQCPNKRQLKRRFTRVSVFRSSHLSSGLAATSLNGLETSPR